MKKKEANLIELVDFLKSYLKEHGYPPTVREMCKAIDISSTSTIDYYLKELIKTNVIKKDRSKNRAIEFVKNEISEDVSFIPKTIPLIGGVTAGLPILAEQNLIENYQISPSLFKGEELFMLNVIGDSMIDAGILNNDLIVVNKQCTAEDGEIVVALIDDSATVKRFFKEKNGIRLQPENPLYSPIIDKNITILGKVIGLIRHI